MTKLKKTFDCSQETLYLVCVAAWNLTTKFLDNFAAFRAVYTPKYIAAAIKAVKDAENLPSSVGSINGRTILRTATLNALIAVQRDWQNLKTYIGNAFDADQVKAQVKIAGGTFYAKVSAKHFSAANGLITAALAFVNKNIDVLTAGGTNMPADFLDNFQQHCDTFTAALADYTTARLEAKQATGNKSDANQQVYAALQNMLEDGKKIFAGNKVAASQFVFSELKTMYKGGSASLTGKVTNENNVAINGAVITSADSLYSAVTNKKGYYRISRMAEGTYKFNITCPGYMPVDVTVTLSAGVRSKADASLINNNVKVA